MGEAPGPREPNITRPVFQTCDFEEIIEDSFFSWLIGAGQADWVESHARIRWLAHVIVFWIHLVNLVLLFAADEGQELAIYFVLLIQNRSHAHHFSNHLYIASHWHHFFKHVVVCYLKCLLNAVIDALYHFLQAITLMINCNFIAIDFLLAFINLFHHLGIVIADFFENVVLLCI